MTDFDLPIVINSSVQKWMNYFTGKGRPHFEKYLQRSEYFIPYLLPILKEHQAPLDLVYLSMIESGFNNHAKSHARAVGAWQFISATGRRYGLRVDWWVDERRDVAKSTAAAARYLLDLYRMFRNWELAAAAYNAGESKIDRAIRKHRTNDFWQLARYRFLRSETRNYVPKLMAAALLAKNRTLFGFQKTYDQPLIAEGEEPSPVEIDETEISTTGPASASQETAELADGEEEVEIPDEAEARLADDSFPTRGTIAKKTESLPVPIPHVDRKGAVGGSQVAIVEVDSPADLFKIARAANVPYEMVRALNPEVLRWVTPPSINPYPIRLPSSAKSSFLQAYRHPAFPRQLEFRTVKAKRGDTAKSIARRLGIRPDPVEDLNGIKENQPLAAGKEIKLPIPADFGSGSLATLDLLDPPERKRSRRRRGVRRAGAGMDSRWESRGERISLEERKRARAQPTGNF